MRPAIDPPEDFSSCCPDCGSESEGVCRDCADERNARAEALDRVATRVGDLHAPLAYAIAEWRARGTAAHRELVLTIFRSSADAAFKARVFDLALGAGHDATRERVAECIEDVVIVDELKRAEREVRDAAAE